MKKQIEEGKVKDLFLETKKVVATYKEKVGELDQQENELKAELDTLTHELTLNLLDQEGATLSERIYLKAQAKGINSKVEIIDTMLEEIDEAKTALKMEYVPIYREVLQQDRKGFSQYNANEIVDHYRYQMLKEIADIGKQMQSQYNELAPDIFEVFQDPKVKENFKRIEYSFNRDHYKPSYSESIDTVISRYDVFNATGGAISDRIPTPKDVE